MSAITIDAEAEVLAALDPSVYATSVAEHAAWAASRMHAPLRLLHAVERRSAPVMLDWSGSLSLEAREELLGQWAMFDQQRSELVERKGRVLLEQTQARLRETPGIECEIELAEGGVLESLLQREPDVRLYVIGKRGEHADFAKGHLGSHLERVVRAVERPVLVAARAFRPIGRFMIAFDGSATSRRMVERVAISPLLKGLDCELLSVGDSSPNQQAHLQWACAELRGHGFAPQARILPGDAESVIAQQIAELSVDLLVMGAYGHSRIRSLILGSTTTQVLRGCPLSVLLLR